MSYHDHGMEDKCVIPSVIGASWINMKLEPDNFILIEAIASK